MVIKRVGPLSVAKITGSLYAILGLIAGGFISLFALAGAFSSDEGGVAALGALFGVGAIILIPLIYGCIGFVMTLIMAWIYNVLASLVGGVEIDVQ